MRSPTTSADARARDYVVLGHGALLAMSLAACGAAAWSVAVLWVWWWPRW